MIILALERTLLKMEFPVIIQKFNPNMEVLDNIKSPLQFNFFVVVSMLFLREYTS